MEKKRVLHIITRIVVGGAQFNTMYSCELIDENKYDVTMLAGSQTGPEGSIESDILSRRINYVEFDELVREINPIKDFKALIRLYKYIKKNKFDIVHTHSSKAGILGRLAAFLAGTPTIIHTSHGWGFHDRMGILLRNFYITIEKLIAPITDKLIVVSDLNREKGLAAGISKESKYITIHSGIDIDMFKNKISSREKMRAEFNIKPDEILVGNVSRLSPQKSPETFIEVAKKVTSAFSNVKFMFVGGGPFRAKCEALIEKYGLQEKVFLIGLRKDVPEVMSMFDIFTLTSLWEGLPRVLPEAMAMGIPIVATNVDGAPQAIEEGVSGYLVPLGDIDMFEERILEFIKDAPKRERFSEAASKTVASRFCVKQMVRDIEKVYEEFS
jgi:glycosyltransferase involved in cell wall biosynthesis